MKFFVGILLGFLIGDWYGVKWQKEKHSLLFDSQCEEEVNSLHEQYFQTLKRRDEKCEEDCAEAVKAEIEKVYQDMKMSVPKEGK